MAMKMLTPEELEKLKLSQSQSQKASQSSSGKKGSSSSITGEMLFDVTFPSNGKHGYPERVTCRPLKVSDIKPLIASRIDNEVAYLRRLLKVLQGTIVEPAGFDLMNLTWNDLVKLVIAHRVNSLGAVADLGYTCDACGNRGVYSVNLISDLAETPIGDDFIGDPFEVKGIKVRFPRVKDFLREGVSFLTDITDYDLVKSAVEGIDIDSLEYGAFWEILETLRKYDKYGVNTRVSVKCGKCGSEVEVVVPCFLLLVTRDVI